MFLHSKLNLVDGRCWIEGSYSLTHSHSSEYLLLKHVTPNIEARIPILIVSIGNNKNDVFIFSGQFTISSH